jgi:LEA14-like dessication related protein
MRRAILTAMLLSLGACATLQRLTFERPTVAISEVHITGLGLSGGSLDVVLDIYNPNSYELRSPRLDATLDLEHTHFGTLGLEQPLQLPAGSHSSVNLPLRFTWEGVGAGAKALLQSGSVRYNLGGQMYVDTPIGQETVGLSTTGTATMRDLIR